MNCLHISRVTKMFGAPQPPIFFLRASAKNSFALPRARETLNCRCFQKGLPYLRWCPLCPHTLTYIAAIKSSDRRDRRTRRTYVLHTSILITLHSGITSGRLRSSEIDANRAILYARNLRQMRDKSFKLIMRSVTELLHCTIQPRLR